MCNPGFLSYASQKELMGQYPKMLKHKTKNTLAMDLNECVVLISITS